MLTARSARFGFISLADSGTEHYTGSMGQTRQLKVFLLIVSVIASFLALSGCRAPREDPFVSLDKKFGAGSSVPLDQYYLDSTGVKIKLKGIVLEADPAQVETLLNVIYSGYVTVLPFRIEKNYGHGGKKDKVAIIARIDQFSLLNELQTGSKSEAVTTAAIVKALKDINAKTRIRITGAGIDFVEFTFVDEVRDWPAMTQACMAIAPNIVTFGTGSAKELQKELKQYNGAILWWN